jgi:hypothetical protein
VKYRLTSKSFHAPFHISNLLWHNSSFKRHSRVVWLLVHQITLFLCLKSLCMYLFTFHILMTIWLICAHLFCHFSDLICLRAHLLSCVDSLSLVRFLSSYHFFWDPIVCSLLLLIFSLYCAAVWSGWCGRRTSHRQGEDTTRTLLAPSGRSRERRFILSNKRAGRSVTHQVLLYVNREYGLKHGMSMRIVISISWSFSPITILVSHLCHTRFWKVNRMRTMYVPGSEIHVHSDYINDSS